MTRIEALQQLASEHIEAAKALSMHPKAVGQQWHRTEAARIADLIANCEPDPSSTWQLPPSPTVLPDVICNTNEQ